MGEQSGWSVLAGLTKATVGDGGGEDEVTGGGAGVDDCR